LGKRELKEDEKLILYNVLPESLNSIAECFVNSYYEFPASREFKKVVLPSGIVSNPKPQDVINAVKLSNIITTKIQENPTIQLIQDTWEIKEPFDRWGGTLRKYTLDRIVTSSEGVLVPERIVEIEGFLVP